MFEWLVIVAVFAFVLWFMFSQRLGGPDPAKVLADTMAYVRGLAAKLGREAWRPVLGWVGIYVAYYAYIQAPQAGLTLDYASVNTFLGMVTAIALGRGVEKHMELRTPVPGGGLVNPAALAPSA